MKTTRLLHIAQKSMPTSRYLLLLTKYLEKYHLNQNFLVHQIPPQIRVLDTTMRDGEQGHGIRSLSKKNKILIAKKLDEIGVDIIEAGSAISSEKEKEAIKAISELGLNAKIASFARIMKKDVDAAAEAKADLIHLVFPSSDLHIKYKLRKRPKDALIGILEMIDYAKQKGLKVELSAEDGSRANPKYLKDVFLSAQEKGADGFCVCDTVGVLSPEYTFSLFTYLKADLSKYLAIHCHNDMGLATANTIASLRAGAEEFHCTFNGMGDRTGNTSLEEIVMNLALQYGIHTIRIEKIRETSQLIAGLTNFYPAVNKPLVGKGAFEHGAGIHVDGILKTPRLYEPFDPQIIGTKRDITLGKLSGSKSIRYKCKELGVKLPEEKEKELLIAVKQLGETGLKVSDADFLMLVQRISEGKTDEKVMIEEIVVTTGNKISPTASVHLRINGNEKLKFGAAIGNGPVDAALKAMGKALGKHALELLSYHVDAISGGSDAGVNVNVYVRKGRKKITSSAFGTDIVLTSVEAVRKALNVLG